MAASALESRLSAIETELAQLKAKVESVSAAHQPSWKQIVGAFAGDPAFLDAMHLGREWREAQRPKPRKPRKRKPC